MSEHIEMQAGDVKALLRIAPDSEVRYYLCGIFFDPTAATPAPPPRRRTRRDGRRGRDDGCRRG